MNNTSILNTPEIDAEHVASIDLAERLGFVREGCLREHETTHKGLCNMLIYGLLCREWQVAQSSSKISND